jgi:hypothetical protein
LVAPIALAINYPDFCRDIIEFLDTARTIGFNPDVFLRELED